MEHSARCRSGGSGLTDPREILVAGLGELGLQLSEDQQEQLLRLARIVERWNERINLSGHRSAAEITARLVLDAIAMSQHLPPNARSLVDLGSGAGFPGLPLAVMWPGTRILLVESRERRHHFQRAAIRELGAVNVRALRGRIEELEPEPAQIVTAQAVQRPERLLAAMIPWIEPGGIAAIPGSEEPPAPPPHPEIEAFEIRRYRSPGGGARRTIWMGRRR